MTSIMQGPFHGVFRSLGATMAMRREKVDQGQVSLDIFEQAGYLVIKAAIAGLTMEDLDIEVQEDTVTIRGRRENKDDIAPDQYYLQECYWGEFSRTVKLPFSVNPSKVRATFSKDGILKILIPREQRVRIVKISEAA